MTSPELKQDLIHKITEIDDISFLKELKTILDSKTGTEVILLTAEQRSEIIDPQREVEQGLFIEQEELDKKFSEWANAR